MARDCIYSRQRAGLPDHWPESWHTLVAGPSITQASSSHSY